MRPINRIIVHCSATPPDMDIGAADIDGWHKARGWSGIGYHFVIRRNGVMEKGRPLDRAGAHTRGHNADSIGICLVGGVNGRGQDQFNYTRRQMSAMEALVDGLRRSHSIPAALVLGHNNFTSLKTCPVFDVPAYFGALVHLKQGPADPDDTEGF